MGYRLYRGLWRFEDMFNSLKAKVSLVYVVLIALMVLLGSVSIFSLNNIKRAVDNIVITNYNSIQRLAQMQDALNSQNIVLLNALENTHDEKAQQLFEEQHLYFLKNFTAEKKTIVIPYEHQLVNNIESEYNNFINIAERLFRAEGIPSSQAYYNEQVLPALADVKAQMQKLVLSNETALFGRKEEAMTLVKNSTAILAFLFFMAGIISFYSMRIYTNKLFSPIYDITQNLRALRQGNLDRKSYVHTNDELGELCDEFNKMTQRLSEFEKSTLGELMAERNRTVAIVRSISEPLIILNSDQRITMLNQSAEKLLKLSMDRDAGKDFLSNILYSSFYSAFSKVLGNAQTYTEEIVCMGPDRFEKYYNATFTPLNYGGLEPGSLIIVLYDKTELKKIDNMRSSFIATISHEFKTPLTSIVFGADLLSDGSLGSMNSDQQDVVITIKEDGERLSNLVSDLLLLSRIESPSTIYQFERCDLFDVIKSSLSQYGPIAEKNGLSVMVRIPSDLPYVCIDSEKIKWVLNNLISNAIKYTPSGDITIRAEVWDEFITVEVSDTGIGIPREFLERIFDKYVQVNTYDLEGRGSGLGLAVAKAIIEAHGGKIWCESSLEKGSSFFFTIPTQKGA